MSQIWSLFVTCYDNFAHSTGNELMNINAMPLGNFAKKLSYAWKQHYFFLQKNKLFAISIFFVNSAMLKWETSAKKSLQVIDFLAQTRTNNVKYKKAARVLISWENIEQKKSFLPKNCFHIINFANVSHSHILEIIGHDCAVLALAWPFFAE